MAQGHGRFYHLFIYPIAQAPYLLDSLAVVNFSRILSSGLVQVAYFGFVRELFGVRLALLSGFLFLGLFNTVGGSYNPFHGLPFWFNIGMGFVLASYWAYARCRRLGRSQRMAYLLFFAALLTYEVMIVYAVGFALMHFALADARADAREGRARRFLRGESGLILVVGTYIALYLGFRYFFPGSYEGARQLSIGPWQDITRTIWNFSISGVYVRLPTRIEAVVWRPLLYAAAVAIGLTLTWRYVPHARARLGAGATIVVLAVTMFAFAPNLLFGFTERYRAWGERFYLASYYAAFAICLALAVAVERMREWSASPWRPAVLIFLLASFSMAAYANQVQSLRFYDESRRDAFRWRAMDALARAILESEWSVSRVCTKSFIEREDPYDYWSYYLTRRIGKPVAVLVRDPKDASCDVHVVLERDGGAMTLRMARTVGANESSTGGSLTTILRSR